MYTPQTASYKLFPFLFKSLPGIKAETGKEVFFPTIQRPHIEKLDSFDKRFEIVPNANINFYEGKLNPYKPTLKVFYDLHP
jgi:hypothetical protein